jgi:CBS domain-containing protein
MIVCIDRVPFNSTWHSHDFALFVMQAFAALIHHKIRAAVLWDSSSQQYIGMITVSDFINILRKYYVSPLVKIDELEDHQIQTWRDITAVDKSRPSTLVCIDPNASLYDAVLTLRSTRVHRLPVIDNRTGNALYIATLAKILKYARQVSASHCLLLSTEAEIGVVRGRLRGVHVQWCVSAGCRGIQGWLYGCAVCVPAPRRATTYVSVNTLTQPRGHHAGGAVGKVPNVDGGNDQGPRDRDSEECGRGV